MLCLLQDPVASCVSGAAALLVGFALNMFAECNAVGEAKEPSTIDWCHTSKAIFLLPSEDDFNYLLQCNFIVWNCYIWQISANLYNKESDKYQNTTTSNNHRHPRIYLLMCKRVHCHPIHYEYSAAEALELSSLYGKCECNEDK